MIALEMKTEYVFILYEGGMICMNSVEIAFPVKELKEEYQNETAWSDPEKTNHHGVLKDHTWHIMGVFEDQYILFDDNGNCAYAPVDWFWEGNG